MMEWIGGKPKSRFVLEQEKNLSKTVNVLKKSMKKKFNIDFDGFAIVERNESVYIHGKKRTLSIEKIQDNEFDFRFQLALEDNSLNLYNNHINYFKNFNFLNSSSTKNLEINLNNHNYFNNNFESFMLIFNSFFKEVTFTYSAKTTTNLNLDSFIYNIFTPTLNCTSETIKIVGREPSLECLKSRKNTLSGYQEFNCVLGSEAENHQTFLNLMNQSLFPNNDINFLIDDNIDTIKQKVSLAEMLNI